MSTEPAQNLQNHSKTPLPIIAVCVLCIAAIALVIGAHVITMGALSSAAIVVLALAVGFLAYKDRMSDLCLQDRIIRLEMQVRLHKLGLGEQADKLSLRQLISLRFASDAELPALSQKVLAENISTSAEIKKLIKNWQADHQRV